MNTTFSFNKCVWTRMFYHVEVHWYGINQNSQVSVPVCDASSSHLQAQKDVEELRTLVASASRKRVQDMLANELRRMEIEVSPSALCSASWNIHSYSRNVLFCPPRKCALQTRVKYSNRIIISSWNCIYKECWFFVNVLIPGCGGRWLILAIST